MGNEGTTVQGEVGEYVVHAPIPPAQGAEDKKPIPAPADEGTKPTGEAAEVVEGEQETPEQAEQKKQSKFQRRLDRQKTARVAAETEAKLLREERDALKAKLEAKPADDMKEPKREDFQDYEAYLRAAAKHDAAQETSKALKADREERDSKDKQRSAASGQEKLAKDWTEREETFQKEAKDYVDVVQPFVDEGLQNLSDVARRAIAESEMGPQLLYHLGQHEDVAEKIAELSPLQQVKELGKLEANLPAAKPKGKAASDAPPPIKPTNTGRSAGHGYSENMSDPEYREWRKANGARWAR